MCVCVLSRSTTIPSCCLFSSHAAVVRVDCWSLACGLWKSLGRDRCNRHCPPWRRTKKACSLALLWAKIKRSAYLPRYFTYLLFTLTGFQRSWSHYSLGHCIPISLYPQVIGSALGSCARGKRLDSFGKVWFHWREHPTLVIRKHF
jgi:hypothetical protein